MQYGLLGEKRMRNKVPYKDILVNDGSCVWQWSHGAEKFVSLNDIVAIIKH
jgi:hypothetical protein